MTQTKQRTNWKAQVLAAAALITKLREGNEILQAKREKAYACPNCTCAHCSTTAEELARGWIGGDLFREGVLVAFFIQGRDGAYEGRGVDGIPTVSNDRARLMRILEGTEVLT